MVYHNAECGNTGIIEEVNTYPYKGASKRQKGYRVMIKADYDNDFIYHVSVFETLEEANKLYPIKWTHKEKRIPSSGHVERQCVPWKWTHQQIGNP